MIKEGNGLEQWSAHGKLIRYEGVIERKNFRSSLWEGGPQEKTEGKCRKE